MFRCRTKLPSGRTLSGLSVPRGFRVVSTVPRQPPLFSQTVTLSDGATIKIKTTSPRPVLKLTKDIRNSPLWNPNLKVEVDESVKMTSFNSKFGETALDVGDMQFGFAGDFSSKKKELPAPVVTPQSPSGKKKAK